MAQKNNSGSNTTGNVLTDFIAGCRQGVNTNFFVQIPNFIFAFVLIQILNVSGLMDLINTALAPVMGIFGLPGSAGAILATGWLSTSGAIGAMVSLYETYGYYKEGLETMTLKGMDGAEKIQSMMNEMRNNPPKKIGAWDVLALRDYKKDTRTDMTGGEVTPTGLPESNVLYYELSNNAWCCVRPSGTEPKIKFYFGVVGTDIKDSEKKLDELRNAMLTYAGE